MIGLIDESGRYWEADADIVSIYDPETGAKISGPETVPLRPDADHEWDGASWKPRTLTLDEVKAREKEQVANQASKRMSQVDAAIRRAVVQLAKGRAVPAALLARIEKEDAIEDARDAAMAAIDAAATRAAARAVAGAIVWP